MLRRKDESLGGHNLSRKDLIARGLVLSLPWLALVNISFALMILLRNPLFQQIDFRYHVSRVPGLMLDGAMISEIALALLTLRLGRHSSSRLSFPLLLSGGIWAVTCFFFIASLQLPFAWPLCSILLLCATAALYFYPRGMLSFALPVWMMMPVASLVLHQGVSINFFVSWTLFSVILVYGRSILMRWFDEAWRRTQENQLLITRLDAVAHLDPLTEVANRRALNRLLESSVIQQKSFSILMLDVDFFKKYNDLYGHQAGDECLLRVTNVLKQNVRHPDDLVARYGGEEFVVVLFEAMEKTAKQVAARIQKSLRAEAIQHEASSISEYVTVSIGIAIFTSDKTASEVIANADAALYRAKESGRNRWAW